MTQAVIRNAGECRTIAVVGDVYRFMATGDDTNGKYALWEAIVPPGGGPPPHVHSREKRDSTYSKARSRSTSVRNGLWPAPGCSPICRSECLTPSRTRAASQPRC